MARLRLARVQIGDTLQRLALRELGDAQRWRDLVTLNALTPPYLVESVVPADRRAGTLLWGDTLAVPTTTEAGGDVVGADALGRDVRVTAGLLDDNGVGDLALTNGTANFGQALRHRVITRYGSFLPHPDYGCEIHAFLGLGNTPGLMLLGAGLVRRAMLRDPRSASVTVGAEVDGDRLLVAASVQAVTRESVSDLNLIYQLPVT